MWRSIRCSISSSFSGRCLTVARQEIETDLGVENIFRQRAKRKKIRGLLLQFIEAGLPTLAGRLQGHDDGVP